MCLPKILAPVHPILMKHHEKKLYLKFYKTVGTFHLLDLDLKWALHDVNFFSLNFKFLILMITMRN